MAEVLPAKKWYQSKTIITNIALAVGVIFIPGINEWAVANVDMIAMGWTIINTILRLVTKGKIEIL